MSFIRRTLILLLALPGTALAQTGRPEIIRDNYHDVSPPLRELPPGPRRFGNLEAEPVRRIPSSRGLTFENDPVVQAPRKTGAPALLSPTLTNSFEGVGQGFTGPAGTFVVNSAPPD